MSTTANSPNSVSDKVATLTDTYRDYYWNVYPNVANLTDFDDNYFAKLDNCHGYRDFDFLMRDIWMYFGYSILILGTIGHLLVIVLLLLNKGMRSLPLSVFLLTMSAAGLMALYMGLLPTIIEHQTCRYERFEDKMTEAGCQFFVAAIYFFLQLYSWMEASVAVERMCAVRWALIYRTMPTRRNNALVTGIIVIVLMAINSIHFKIFGNSHHSCQVEDLELFKIWHFVHSAVYILLPVSVMLPANVVTLHTMYCSPMKSSKEVKKAKPVAVMMIILNGIFVVTTPPILVVDYMYFATSEYDAWQVAWAASNLLVYLGCSLTFPVYVMVAAMFRKTLAPLLGTEKNKIHTALVVMPSVGGQVSGKRDEYHMTHCAGTEIRDQADSSANMTTGGKV